MLSQLRTEMDTLSGGEKMSKTTWCQNLSTVLSTKKSVLLSWQFNFWSFLQLCTWYTFNVKLYSVEINYCIIVSLYFIYCKGIAVWYIQTGVLLYGICRGVVIRMSIFCPDIGISTCSILFPSELHKCTCDHFWLF